MTWLEKAIDLLSTSNINLQEVSYESMIIIFYDHLSNRNLSILISEVYNMDAGDVYFKIDKIVGNLYEYNIDEVKEVSEKLYQNNFQEWIEDDGI